MWFNFWLARGWKFGLEQRLPYSWHLPVVIRARGKYLISHLYYHGLDKINTRHSVRFLSSFFFIFLSFTTRHKTYNLIKRKIINFNFKAQEKKMEFENQKRIVSFRPFHFVVKYAFLYCEMLFKSAPETVSEASFLLLKSENEIRVSAGLKWIRLLVVGGFRRNFQRHFWWSSSVSRYDPRGFLTCAFLSFKKQ